MHLKKLMLWTPKQKLPGQQKRRLPLRTKKSLETSKNLVSVSNTGPTSLIRSNGKIETLLKPNKEIVQNFELELNGKKTVYTYIYDLILISVFLLSLIGVLKIRKYS